MKKKILVSISSLMCLSLSLDQGSAMDQKSAGQAQKQAITVPAALPFKLRPRAGAPAIDRAAADREAVDPAADREASDREAATAEQPGSVAPKDAPAAAAPKRDASTAEAKRVERAFEVVYEEFRRIGRAVDTAKIAVANAQEPELARRAENVLADVKAAEQAVLAKLREIGAKAAEEPLLEATAAATEASAIEASGIADRAIESLLSVSLPVAIFVVFENEAATATATPTAAATVAMPLDTEIAIVDEAAEEEA